MQYSEGRLGRVFVLRIDDGEDFLAVTREFVKNKAVQAGSLLFLGALRQGRMVTGPESLAIPPEPHYVMFEGGWEMVGMGTICPGEDGPAIHFHASVGRAGHALTGCLREKAVTYIVAEVIVLEFTGLDIRRQPDEKTGLALPVHGTAGGTGQHPSLSAVPGATPGEPVPEEKEDEDTPGGLAEIIRDLTRRPRT
ncbi:PPC domain-containing DNA-binding protein [Methanoregula sp.]|uniref:PPC domain-containing DNA-binding protein n=1 Tax=Methanoregula sp. TaxID=2052170 RepID=UPI002C651C4B|nr:PPC domain-containing DNA-binding protein [Methanoregula sp.]HVP95677.1 PPC domain-containing DNA-binding protein [Methanoregula sp.]